MKRSFPVVPVLLVCLSFLGASCESDGYSSESDSASEPWAKPATPLPAAIQKAQQNYPGSRCTDAVFRASGGGLICTVRLVQGETFHEIVIDGQDGSPSGDMEVVKNQETLGVLAEFDKLSPGVSLLQAVNAALKEESGYWSMGAALGRENGKLVYQVVLAKNRTTKVARVSAATGKVESVEKVEQESPR